MNQTIWLPDFSVVKQATCSKEINVVELIPSKCWLLRHLLSTEECGLLVQELERCAESFQTYGPGLRIYLADQEVASFLSERMKSLNIIPEVIEGGWTLNGINPEIRYGKYLPGQFFSSHIDNPYYPQEGNFNWRSHLTLMIYLNKAKNSKTEKPRESGGDFDGGSTRFWKPGTDNELWHEIIPEEGLGILFWQADGDLLHDGSTVNHGVKYILRTDVLYKKKINHFIIHARDHLSTRIK